MFSPTTFAQFLKKLPKPIYKFLGKRWIDDRFPRHIFIELTSDCQLRCSHCPRPRISRHLPFGLFKKIVDEASRFGKRSFSLHLFGEPLLYPFFSDAVKYLKRRKHTVLVTTNGILLGKHIDSLKLVDKIIWSYKENVQVPYAIKNWKNFTVRFFGKAVGEWKNYEVRTLHNYGGSLESIVPCMDEARYPCYHPFLAPGVTATGEIVICCADPNVRSSVGNIKNMTIETAWKLMEKTRNEHLKGEFKGICKNCDVWKSYPSLF